MMLYFIVNYGWSPEISFGFSEAMIKSGLKELQKKYFSQDECSCMNAAVKLYKEKIQEQHTKLAIDF